MADVITSPNMLLPVPTVSVCPSPAWANDINSCLSIIDQHTHAAGSGIQITQAGISLTANATTFDSLSFNASNAFALRSARFTPQVSALALATDLGCLYEAGVDLYYNDGSGNQIRLTQSGSPVGGGGSITGLPSGTASASYSGGTFIWQSATSTAANMDAGSYILRNSTASSKGLTLQAPNAMAADYSLTLPALPGVTSIMALDSSGNITAPYTVDNSTIVIASNIIKVPAGGITGTQIASATVTRANIVAVGQQVSSTFTQALSAGSLTAITGATVTITTHGNPVIVGIQSDGTTASPGSNIFLKPNSLSSPGTINLAIFRDGTQINGWLYGSIDTSSVTTEIFWPTNYFYLDVGASAASHTYILKYAISNLASANISNTVLFAYELT